jgi:hypothetical protein
MLLPLQAGPQVARPWHTRSYLPYSRRIRFTRQECHLHGRNNTNRCYKPNLNLNLTTCTSTSTSASNSTSTCRLCNDRVGVVCCLTVQTQWPQGHHFGGANSQLVLVTKHDRPECPMNVFGRQEDDAPEGGSTTRHPRHGTCAGGIPPQSTSA